MIRRATDALFINAVLNDPAVRPDVADLGEGVLDITKLVANPANVCLVSEHGALFFYKFYNGCYEVHTQVLPRGRGAGSRQLAIDGAHYMFTATDCVEILTRVPEGHVAATALTEWMGFARQFTTAPECKWRGKYVPATIWSLTIQDWALRQDGAKGHAFHERMNGLLSGQPHPEDPDHNRIVGIALDMFRAGQTVKAVIWYNRWAFAARHPAVQLVSVEPPEVRFDAGVLTLVDGTIHLRPDAEFTRH